jgi:hypothetical protein
MFTSPLLGGNSDSTGIIYLIIVATQLIYIGTNQNICTEISHPVIHVIFVILHRYFPESNEKQSEAHYGGTTGPHMVLGGFRVNCLIPGTTPGVVYI